MKLRKVIIDGKTYYTDDDENTLEVSKEEYLHKGEKLYNSYLEKSKSNSTEYQEDLLEALSDYKNEIASSSDLEDLDDLYDDLKDNFEDALDSYQDDLDDMDDDDEEDDDEDDDFINDYTKSKDTSKNNKKTQDVKEATTEAFKKALNHQNIKLLSILPFMEREDIHSLAVKLASGDDESFKNISLVTLMPFLSQEDCDMLFLKTLNLKKDINYIALAPFVSSKVLSHVVDKYINGEITLKHIEGLYPFLDKDDIRRLFAYLSKQQQ